MMHLILRVPTSNKSTLIIAAISSRPYVNAAVKAGYEVIAIDGFSDVDTKRIAQKVVQVRLEGGQLNGEDVLAAISREHSETILGFCYGAGFEAQPDLLSKIGQYINVLGNTAEVVMQCKAPNYFFECCDEVGVPHPKVAFNKPDIVDGWLQKAIGGAGGAHVKMLSMLNQDAVTRTTVKEGDYFQEYLPGRLASCLFIADVHDVHVVGINEQWVDESVFEPFRYGGAVSQAEISESAKTRFITYVKDLAKALGLVGLNSCDAIVDGDNVWILEVNPRLSATLDLYASIDHHLISMHIAVSQHNVELNLFKLQKECGRSQAHQVIYAEKALRVEHDATWPAWVCDVPKAGSVFKVGMPVCTVLADGKSASFAKKLVNERAVAISSKLLN